MFFGNATMLPYCSRVCCAAAVKNSIKLKEINPGAQIVVLYRDVRTFGFKELYYLKARQKGVLFFRYISEDKPEVYDESGKIIVDFTDRSSHQNFRVEPDLVILSSGIRPDEGAKQIARLLKLPTTDEGFFLEAHVKLRPVEFATSGVFLAGLAHSPRFIEETVTMAKSAGQQAMKVICKEKLTTSAAVAVVHSPIAVPPALFASEYAPMVHRLLMKWVYPRFLRRHAWDAVFVLQNVLQMQLC